MVIYLTLILIHILLYILRVDPRHTLYVAPVFFSAEKSTYIYIYISRRVEIGWFPGRRVMPANQLSSAVRLIGMAGCNAFSHRWFCFASTYIVVSTSV